MKDMTKIYVQINSLIISANFLSKSLWPKIGYHNPKKLVENIMALLDLEKHLENG